MISLDPMSEEESIRKGKNRMKWPMQAAMKTVLQKYFKCIKIDS